MITLTKVEADHLTVYLQLTLPPAEDGATDPHPLAQLLRRLEAQFALPDDEARP